MGETKVITRLDGGLGNQMFQYAVGRALSLRYNTPLYMDASIYRSYTSRQYALGVFNVAAEKLPAPSSPLMDSIPMRSAGRLLGNLARRLPAFASTAVNRLVAKRSTALLTENSTHRYGPVCREKENFEFDPSILDNPPPIYLVGYWQNERYFTTCQAAIRQDFSLRVPVSPRAEHYREMISRQPTASLHIRRGDYVHSTASQRLNVCGLEYYHDALRIVSSKVPGVRIFVFSDEIEWAKVNLKIDRVTFVEGCKDFEELFLMSRCNHNIIANSSFSWWGAWLNMNAGKLVVAPRRWLNEDIGERTPVPSAWQKI